MATHPREHENRLKKAKAIAAAIIQGCNAMATAAPGLATAPGATARALLPEGWAAIARLAKQNKPSEFTVAITVALCEAYDLGLNHGRRRRENPAEHLELEDGS